MASTDCQTLMTGDREICLEAGMDDYITKPVKIAPLIDVISKWVVGDGVGAGDGGGRVEVGAGTGAGAWAE